MFKKSLASIVSAAVLVAGPGNLTLTAAAQTLARGPVTGVSVTPTIGTGLHTPLPGASSFNMPSLTPGALIAPSLAVAPKPVAPAVASPVSLAPVPASLAARPIPAAAKALPATVKGSPLSVIESRDAKVGVAEKGAALNALFENSSVESRASLEVLVRAAASDSPLANRTGLSRSNAVSAASAASIERAAVEKGRAAGELAIVSLIKRAWNAVLGMLGIGVKKLETPEVMAQRIIDQLNAAKPVYNRKVQEASTLVEKLKLQAEGETAKVAELEQGITALLSDSDPANDIMASGMINQQKTLNASIASTQEQIGLAELTLASIKEERARFFSEREETIAKLQAGLTKSAAAGIQKQIAELKGGFQIGDLKDNMDRFEDAVNDKVADAKGTADSVDSNPDQILKKAKDSLKSQEIKDELARRKAAIEQARKDKGQAGGMVKSLMTGINIAASVLMGVYAGFHTGWLAALLGASAVMSAVIPLGTLGAIIGGVFAEKVMKTSGAKTAGASLLGGVIGFILGVVGVGVAGYYGMTVAAPAAAVALGVSALVSTVLGGLYKAVFKTDKKPAAPADDKTAAGGAVGAPRDLSTKEILGLNVAGIAASLAAGFWFGMPLLGILGTFVAPIPVIFAYVGVLRLTGSGVRVPGIRFAPSVSWGGKRQAGGLLLELGVGAAVIAAVALISKPFRNILSRAWNAALGIFGMGVKKMETPEVMAQRIIDQLNAQKPVYNRKVQEASTLVEKLRLQIEKQQAQSADLDRSVTALLSDSDTLNDVMAESLLNQKKTVDASTLMTQEQLTISEKTLISIKEERASFFSEREEMLAKIQAGLTKSKAAEIQKQIAELKGGFQVGDLKDNMDRFEDAVNDKVADAKGTADSVDSNPDQILKKAKDALKNQEVQDEIAKRKAAIEAARKAKGAAGGAVTQGQALGWFAKTVGIGFALISPMLAALVLAAAGGVALVMAPEQGRWLGRQLAVIGLGTLAIGAAASFAVAKLGLTIGAFSVGIGFVVPAGIALAAGVIATIRAAKKDGATVADVASTPAGSSVIPAPVAAPEAASPRSSFSIKPLLDLLARAWNALLGLFGMGVKKMETPEILAQRLIDQLNDAKPVYNRKVQEASTLVEKLRQQIAGEVAKIAEFDKTITALLSDNDPANDIMAAGLLNSQKTLEASVAASKDQLSASEAALVSIKEERARFFSEREETLAKIQAGLTKAKAAEITKQVAELKGGFKIGDLKDNLDRFDGAVADKVADAKGTADAADSNPDQVLKKAKDALRSQEIADELARRKAEIEKAKKDKGAAGGAVTSGHFAGAALGAVIAAINPVTALVIVATLGALTLGDSLATARRGLNFAHIDKAGKFFAYSIGTAVIGAMLLGFGLPLAQAAIIFGASALSGAIGYAHLRIAKRQNNGKGAAGGLLLELGVGAAVIAAVALVSKPFRNILSRAWNAALGIFGMGVKKMETPEVMAQRIIDQLNAQKPVYNRKVQEASTLVEKLRLQIEKQEKQSADLDRSVTALLSDSDTLNDVMAESLLNQKKTVDASTLLTQEQLTISEKTLISIKEERASFFSEREEMLARIQAGLTKSKAAEIQKQIAELKGGFQVGDLKDNMDRFEDAVNDKVADAKGTADSVDSNPDQILKKAKDALKNQEVQDEIAKRKAAIEAARKAKGAAGGLVAGGNIGKGLAVYALGAAFIAAVMGFIPGFAPVGNLDLALRILGVVSIWAAMDIIEKGRYDKTMRSMIMVGAGTATMLAAAGVFGALGGLTAIALGLTGFFFAWRGIARLASKK